MPRYGLIDSDYSLRLRTAAPSADGTIYMLNLTKYLPDNDPGLGDGPRGAWQLADRYSPGRYAPIPLLTAVGANLCFVAEVLASSGDWDNVAVVSYPSRRAFLELAGRPEFQTWHAQKQSLVERTAVFGTVPVQDLPEAAGSRLMLLELWDGPDPQPITSHPFTPFGVEGTIVGDGRSWTGARYTVIEPGLPLPIQQPRPDYQALLLEPRVERWQ